MGSPGRFAMVFSPVIIARIAGLLLVVLCLQPVAGEPPREPAAVVEGFHEELLALMQGDFSYAERERRMRGAVQERFDMPTIGRITVGGTWRKLEKDQRTALLEALTDLTATTYADRFDSYNEHRFVTLDTSDAGGGRSRVRTELQRVNRDSVQLDYFLLDGLIFNVVADGVSDLSLRRAEYAAILRDGGFAALLSEIRSKIEQYRDSGEP